MRAMVIENWRNDITDEDQLERFIKCNSSVPLQLDVDLLKEALSEVCKIRT
jgi:hypothetical protein